MSLNKEIASALERVCHAVQLIGILYVGRERESSKKKGS